jgi:putative oxidoreductase
MNTLVKNRLLGWLDWAFRIVVAAVFLLAAIPKMQDPLAFAKAITNYKFVLPVIGQNYIFAAAMFMPALEAVSALALLWNRFKKTGALLCGLLLLLFIVLIAQAMARGLNIDCGCFGTGAVAKALAQKVGFSKLIENAVLTVMCGYVYWRTKAQR